MANLKQLQAQVISFRDQRNWKQFHTPKGLAIGLLVELGELAEHVQYIDGDELQAYIKTHRGEIGEEMSDVLYWLLVMAEEFGIDLENAFKHKMEKNALKYPVSPDGRTVGKLVNKLASEHTKKVGKTRSLNAMKTGL